ncbi:hypothetical protein AKJ08_2817 [Vulgatibacter incomptus]|uniref:Uncharacterized protein n=1 Tax=Vulgatibacter incomptus TaxID=1391653 RepID=A0A0K1PFY6_9BACT|nr:hypothetical protein AKJ08_2817 [Vulgatibacter incomptus]
MDPPARLAVALSPALGFALYHLAPALRNVDRPAIESAAGRPPPD